MWLAKLKQLFGKPKSAGDESRDSQWCLVGNIGDAGLRHFQPGTKVYCFPALWGDGYEKVMVIGHHRGSHKLVTMIIDSASVTNWRAKVVYNPEVLRRLGEATFAGREVNARTWPSKKEVDEYLKALRNTASR